MRSGAPDVSAGVSGTKKVIFLLVKFQGEAAVPHPPVFYTNMTNPSTPPAGEVFPTTINGFFLKTSYNQFSWVGSVGGVGGLGAPGGWCVACAGGSASAGRGWFQLAGGHPSGGLRRLGLAEVGEPVFQ